MIKHQIEALAEAGVTDIVLAVNYRPEVMEAHLKEVGPTPSFPRSFTFGPAYLNPHVVLPFTVASAPPPPNKACWNVN